MTITTFGSAAGAGGSGGTSFDKITGGTNTTADMVVGNGADIKINSGGALVVNQGGAIKSGFGSRNTVLGDLTFATAAGGTDNDNTAIGYNALHTVNGGAGKNTAVGSGAGSAITTGNSNTCIGKGAGVGNTTGSNNTYLGNLAGQNIVTGTNMICIGDTCGPGVGGDHSACVYIGDSVAQSDTNGTPSWQNVCIGHLCYASGSGATSLVAMGYAAARYTASIDCTAIGNQALNVSIADGNTALGAAAGATQSHAEDCRSTFIGRRAGYVTNASAAPDNEANQTFVGYNSGVSVSTGYHDTLLGAYSGQNLTTGYQNTFLGWKADSNANGTHDAIAIGPISKASTGGIIISTNGTNSAVTNDIQIIANDGHGIQPTVHTAGTLTVTNAGMNRTSVARYDWTNAMVVALGANLTGTITVCTVPAKTVISNAYIVITGTAAGTTTLTVCMGRTSAFYFDYIATSDAKGSVNVVYGNDSAERGGNLTGYDLPSMTATTDVKLLFTATGANLDQVTGSTGTVYLETYTLP